jgi:hypothetical protein
MNSKEPDEGAEVSTEYWQVHLSIAAPVCGSYQYRSLVESGQFLRRLALSPRGRRLRGQLAAAIATRSLAEAFTVKAASVYPAQDLYV